MLLTTIINAGSILEFVEPADFFRLLDASFPVTITYYKNGAELVKAESIVEGYSEKFTQDKFDKVTIYSATTQSIQFVTRLGNEVMYDQAPQGLVTLSNMQGAFSQTQKTVTTTSAQLLASNSIRRYVLIQNKDITGNIYITLDGTTATSAKGIQIAPGGSYESPWYAPNGAINAIGDIASNANIVVAEG